MLTLTVTLTFDLKMNRKSSTLPDTCLCYNGQTYANSVYRHRPAKIWSTDRPPDTQTIRWTDMSKAITSLKGA